jgi:hypothetical protein
MAELSKTNNCCIVHVFHSYYLLLWCTILYHSLSAALFFHLVHVFKLCPFYIGCSVAAADTSRSLVWISNVRYLKHHGIISFTTVYWYDWYPSTMLRNLKFHSLAWESDRQVSATEFYCSIIFISDFNEPPLKIRKRLREMWIVVHNVWRSVLSRSHWSFP